MSELLEQLDYFLQLALRLALEHKFLTTLLVISCLMWFKGSLVRFARNRSSSTGEDRRHQINQFRQLYNAFLVVIVFVIWAQEAQEFAISIAAFTVAIVLATRDFIQCFIGFIYYLGARPFRVGDWIETGDHQMGVVVEIDWAKLTLLEVHHDTFEYTGKHIYLPNSRLVTHTIKNLNFLRRYTMHSFELVIEPKINAYEFLPQLLERARIHCDHFKDVAERYKGVIERSLETEFIEIDPEVTIETNEFANIVVMVSLFCPTNEAKELQQKISADFMTLFYTSSAVPQEQPTNSEPA